ncbi:MAG: type II toxin-antitoxin system Y4mF family antitoxin [Balneolaceae bacterium]|nr:type II toxin-antitoxin system Y4mF family antitoxin [Balneolaceae bacterium]
MSKLGAHIRWHRSRSGLTQAELADLAGVGKTAVFDIEHGKSTVQLDTLHRICRALNMTLRLESPLMDQCRKEVERA